MRIACFLGLGALIFHPSLADAQVAVPGAMAKPGVPLVVDRLTVVPTDVPPAPPDGPPLGPALACAPSGPAVPRIWGSAEYLLWWTSAAPVPTPMVTAATNLVDPNSGQLNSPNTAVLLGGQSYGTGARSGGRFTLGTWLDPDALLGVEGTYLFLAPQTAGQAVASNGSPPIGLPYYDALFGVQSLAPLAVLGFRTGGAFLALTNRLQGGEVNGLARLIGTDRVSLLGLAGFRYLNVDEDLNFAFAAFDSAATGLPGRILPGSTASMRTTTSTAAKSACAARCSWATGS